MPTWFMLYRSRWFLLYLANIFPPVLFFPINYYRDDILTGRMRISCLAVRPISHVFCKRRPVWLFSYFFFFYFSTNIMLSAVFVVILRGNQRTVSSVSYLSLVHACCNKTHTRKIIFLMFFSYLLILDYNKFAVPKVIPGQ